MLYSSMSVAFGASGVTIESGGKIMTFSQLSDNKVMINDGGSIIFIEAEKMGDNNIKLKKMDRKTMDICL